MSPSSASAPAIEAHEACPPELARPLLKLFLDVFGQEISEAHWQWKYGGLPGSRRLHVVAQVQAQPVGHVGVLVQPAWAAGPAGRAPVAAWMAHLTDVMVHPAHRGGLGHDGIYPTIMSVMATRLSQWAVQTARPLFAYGFPGLTPSRLGHRMGLYRPLFRVQEHPVAAADGPGWLWGLKECPPGPVPLRLKRELDALDLRVAPLGAMPSAGGTQPPTGQAPRLRKGGDYLEWRYLSHPAQPYRLFLLRNPLGRLRGWCVLRSSPQPWVVDLCADSPGLRRRLLAACGPHPGGPWRTWVGLDAAGPPEQSLIVPVEFRVPGPTRDWPAPAFVPGDTDVF